MKVIIQRVDRDLPLPRYETAGAVGFDLLARIDAVIEPGTLALIPGNIIVEVPEGYMLMVASRSSLPKKKGLLTPHGLGIIDHDYCGPTDEIHVQVYNFSNEPVTVKRGEKIAQGVFVRVNTFEWQEVEVMEKPSRGGFGSTGGYDNVPMPSVTFQSKSQSPHQGALNPSLHQGLQTPANESKNNTYYVLE